MNSLKSCCLSPKTRTLIKIFFIFFYFSEPERASILMALKVLYHQAFSDLEKYCEASKIVLINFVKRGKLIIDHIKNVILNIMTQWANLCLCLFNDRLLDLFDAAGALYKNIYSMMSLAELPNPLTNENIQLLVSKIDEFINDINKT